MGFRAEILLLCAEILPFLGSVQKYYYPGTRGGWILVQGHFWGMCRYIHFWRNIHLCSSVTNTLENIECFQYSHTLQRSYLILGHRGLCWVKTQQVDLLMEEVEAASPCLLLLRRHFLLLLQGGESTPARQAVQPWSKFCSYLATRQAPPRLQALATAVSTTREPPDPALRS